ncbi:hyaluronidase-1-like isoform X1 [Dreissena polymorpha]|uniref:hyaluronidase-1-like isoform X1 n=1 Tax=Dreissena polymorpha TaxID=45954 RepID=UPI002263BACF|nr:hyaluronidase-1-like isoform X1 [Dreissena polymorpha]
MKYMCVVCFILSDMCTMLQIDFESKPFVTIWNVPSEKCLRSFGVDIDLSAFDIVVNTGGTFEGDNMVIFYELGLYPYIDDDGNFVNGGLPQLSDLGSHLLKVKQDVAALIPDANFSGLAVIDWERWRPIFERDNYNNVQRQYITASEDLVRKAHPGWSDERVYEKARQEFENRARQFMERTLVHCSSIRPQGKWGFYGFPGCYNNHNQRTCDTKTMELNDEPDWMFQASSALFPSIYLREKFGNHQARYDRVHGILGEAIRVSNLYGSPYQPLVAYTRFRYGDTSEFYDVTDLHSTLGQTAEAGYNGAALWDSHASFETRDQCLDMRNYLDTTLGPFLKALQDAVNKCSRTKCSAHGRCKNRIRSRDREYGDKYKNKTKPSRAVLSIWETIVSVLRIFWFILLNFVNGERSYFENVGDVSCECFPGWKVATKLTKTTAVSVDWP